MMPRLQFESTDVIELARRILALHSLPQDEIDQLLGKAIAIQDPKVWGDYYLFELQGAEPIRQLGARHASWDWDGVLQDSDGAEVLVLVIPKAGTIVEVEFIRGDGNDLLSLPGGVARKVPQSD